MASHSDTAKPRALGTIAATRSLGVLVPLLMVAFAGALFLQADAQRRDALAESIGGQREIARIAAERASGALSHAWGALAGAAEIGRTSGAVTSHPDAVARAAARARPVSGVMVLDPGTGAVLGGSGNTNPVLARAALRAAGDQQAWAGVATADGKSTPAITRRAGGVVIVSLIDAAKLLPESSKSRHIYIADSAGRILASLPADDAAVGKDAREFLGGKPGDNSDGFHGQKGMAVALAVGVGSVSVGDLQVYATAHARSPFAEMSRALLVNALLAAAPILAVGALLLLMRQNDRRAREAEAEVVRVERRYRLAADGAKAGYFEWNLRTGTISLSQQLATLVRATGDEITLPQLLLAVASEDRGDVEHAFEQARTTGTLDVNFRIVTPNALSWVELRGLAIEDGDDDATSIVGTALDITARRDAELRARALQRRLREAIDSFTGPFALWDSRRRLLLSNKSFQQIFKLDSTVLRPGASYDSIAVASAQQIARDRPDLGDPHTREVEMRDGSWFRIQERRTTEGGLLTVGLDITARKKQEEELQESQSTLRAAVVKLERSEGRIKELARSFEEQKRHAEDASRAKSAFLANMSHELRTPLNAIIGFSEIMSQSLFGPLGDPRYQQYASDILSSGQLLLDLINDVLDMAKIEAGKMSLAPRPLDPMDAIEQASRLVRRRAELKGLQLIVDAPQDLPEIEADHRAVKQMLLNLLTNAVKFTDKGGVMLEARPDGDGVRMRIIDTGRGISATDLPRLARPFEQVENEFARENPGTGIGLALTKSLVEMHGGRLEIESQLGKGTVVTIRLPRAFGGGAGADAVAAE